MAFTFAKLVHAGIATAFAMGGELVKEATFVRPAGLNPTTGLSAAVEITATCKIFGLGFTPQNILVRTQPGDETLIVRASELTGISSPAENDRIIETPSGLVRKVLGCRLDPTGEFWIFQTERVASTAPGAQTGNEDWGDLVAAALFEDRGDLSAVSVSEDWGALF